MRFKHTIYSETVKKLESAGLIERIRKIMKSEDAPVLTGMVYDDQLEGNYEEMKERGYLNSKIKEQKQFIARLNELHKNQDNISWKVWRPEGIAREEMELEDIQILMGWPASYVLNPKEMWDYKKFGFNTESDLFGSIGAFMKNDGRSIFERGYTWETKLPDGRELKNSIGGSTHADLRIFQTDITPYKTKNPMGDDSSYRPQFQKDIGGVWAYHSVEGGLLVGVLKYLKQLKIKSKALEDNAKETIEWGKSLRQGGGSCTEHLGGFDQHPMLFFSGFDVPLPTLNKNYSTKKLPIDGVHIEGGGSYRMFIGPNKELIFSSSKDSKKVVSASYLPEEADHLIKGIIYQSAKGLGRTSGSQLINILEYYYSEAFKKDQAESKARIAKMSHK